MPADLSKFPNLQRLVDTIPSYRQAWLDGKFPPSPRETPWTPDQPSRGLGDTVAKFTHATGLDKVARRVARALGYSDCGCHGPEGRQARLNRAVPYPWQNRLVSDRPVYPCITVRNVIYHVCPLTANDLWLRNVRQLTKRWEVFNGRKIVAIAQGDGCLPADEVQEAFPCPSEIEWLLWPNDRRLREVSTFLPLLQMIASNGPHEATFYAHTKGNATLETSDQKMSDADRIRGATRWRNAMYHHLLDRADLAMKVLGTAPVVGTTKCKYRCTRGFVFPSGLRHGSWMFAGTFFWFRHDAVFSHPKWQAVPQDRYGAEAWLGDLFPPAEAVSLFQPWPENTFPVGSPYDPKHYPAAFDEEPPA